MRHDPAAAVPAADWTATIDDAAVRVPLGANVSLAEAVRDAYALRDQVPPVKIACGEGSCGACSVLVDGRRVLACLQPAWRFAGSRVDTAAHFADSDIPQVLAASGALQCGFCTPGMVVALADLRTRGVQPTDEAALAHLLDANLCRCTGYQQLLAAGVRLLQRPR